MKRSPMLAPNVEVPMTDLKYPVLASLKMDGVRAIVYDGEMLSRNWKPFSTTIQIHFAKFIQQSRKTGHVFDGELYAHGMPFNEIMSAIAPRNTELPDGLHYCAFECTSKGDWDAGNGGHRFDKRVWMCKDWISVHLSPNYTRVEAIGHEIIEDAETLAAFYSGALETAYEGLITRDPAAHYKHGRATILEASIFKFKEWVNADAVIIGFQQATRMKTAVKSGERTRDEMGYLERSSKKDTRELVEAIGSFKVRLEDGVECFVVLSKQMGWAREKLAWATKDQWLGKQVEIRFQGVGTKDKPRFGAITKLREDLE